MNKQVSEIRMAPAFYNGGFRLFDNTSALYPVFDLDADSEDIFEGSDVTTALSKFEFSNLLGNRLMLNFSLELPQDASSIYRTLFNKTSGYYNRQIFATTTNGAGTGITTLVLNSGAPNIDDYFNGTIVKGLTGGSVLITDYVGSTRTATLASSRSWTSALAVTFEIQPNIKTILAVSTDSDANNFVYYNIKRKTYGFSKKSTISTQKVGLSLSSVLMYEAIPESFAVLL
jgi:hypothetical protein